MAVKNLIFYFQVWLSLVALSLTAALRQMQGKRKGAAVENFYRSKVKKIFGHRKSKLRAARKGFLKLFKVRKLN